MMSANYARLSGLAGIISGVLVAAGFLIHPLGETPEFVSSPAWVPAHAILFVGFAISLLCLYGAELQQAGKAGVLGGVGFVLLFLGVAFVGGILFLSATVEPLMVMETQLMEMAEASVIPVFIAIVLLLSVGGIIFGLSVLRASVLPKAAGGLLALASAVLLVASLASLPDLISNASGVLFGISILWLGYGLWKTKPM